MCVGVLGDVLKCVYVCVLRFIDIIIFYISSASFHMLYVPRARNKIRIQLSEWKHLSPIIMLDS